MSYLKSKSSLHYFSYIGFLTLRKYLPVLGYLLLTLPIMFFLQCSRSWHVPLYYPKFTCWNITSKVAFGRSWSHIVGISSFTVKIQRACVHLLPCENISKNFSLWNGENYQIMTESTLPELSSLILQPSEFGKIHHFLFSYLFFLPLPFLCFVFFVFIWYLGVFILY